MDGRILVTRSSMPPFDEYVEEIRGLWGSVWLTNSGAKHQEFERLLAEYTRTPYVSLTVNGHMALENAIAAYGLQGEIITTPFTFVSTTHAIARNGIKPVFCDINEDDYTIDVSKIEALITPATSAILPVHVYGNICKVGEIEDIAMRNGLKVIYDAAHAFGVCVGGKSVMSFGDAAMCSFHATKAFHSIEGGALFTKDKELKRRMEQMKNFGMSSPETVDYISGNAKMNEFQAAMGLCNLRHVNEEILKRKKNAERYYEKLGGVKGIKLTPPPADVESNYAYMPVLFDGERFDRNNIYDRLTTQNIFARKYFFPLTSDFACYRKNKRDNTPTAVRIAANILTLPLYAELSIEEIDDICRIITE